MRTTMLTLAIALFATACGESEDSSQLADDTASEGLDTGEDSATLEIRCPEPGGEPVVREREVSTYVEEKPRVLGGSANFVVKVRVTAYCD